MRRAIMSTAMITDGMQYTVQIKESPCNCSALARATALLTLVEGDSSSPMVVQTAAHLEGVEDRGKGLTPRVNRMLCGGTIPPLPRC